jgi:amino acid transporter
MLVITFGIFLIFIGLLLHMKYVPFKRKFHNLLEYFVLISTLTVLFFGLLFFVDKFPVFWDINLKVLLTVVSLIVIIGSTLFVIILILLDVRKRRQIDKKKRKLKKQKFEELKKKENDAEDILFLIHGKKLGVNVN